MVVAKPRYWVWRTKSPRSWRSALTCSERKEKIAYQLSITDDDFRLRDAMLARYSIATARRLYVSVTSLSSVETDERIDLVFGYIVFSGIRLPSV